MAERRSGAEGLVTPREIVRSGLCIGCGACTSGALEGSADMGWDRYGQLKPRGSSGWHKRETPQFTQTCPFSPRARNENQIAEQRFPAAPGSHALAGRYEAAFVGHVGEGDFRARGSSGGLSTWMATELLRRGLIDGVAHVVSGTSNGEPRFSYRLSRSIERVREGAKSRYYPVHLGDVLREMKAVPGRYAVIGIPCFIKAVHLLRGQDPVLNERISYTLGLFCGHMKSARFADSFAWQLGVAPGEVEQVDYRLKNPERPANWYMAALTLSDGGQVSRDWWHLVDGDWGAGFFQNSACNFCDDVVAETADIAFGDAWLEPYSSDGRGTNVVIVRSKALLELVEQGREEGRLALDPVDADFVVATQEAGFRHRREGLAYRLTWRKRGVRPCKRVRPSADGLPWRRKWVYRARASISRTSHVVASVANVTGIPRLYMLWAKAALAFYQGLTYSRGGWGRLFDLLDRLAARPR